MCLCVFSLEYVIRKVQENDLGLDMNYIHQILAYAGDINLIEADMIAIGRNADILPNA